MPQWLDPGKAETKYYILVSSKQAENSIIFALKNLSFAFDEWQLKFIYSEKATKFCEISTEDLTVTT